MRVNSKGILKNVRKSTGQRGGIQWRNMKGGGGGGGGGGGRGGVIKGNRVDRNYDNCNEWPGCVLKWEKQTMK